MNYIALYPYSAIFYSSILVIATLLAYFQIFLKPNLKRIVLIIIIVFLSLCAGFRAETVGTDTRAYMAFIESCRPGNTPLGYHFELGFVLLVKGILMVVDNPRVVLVSIALIINSLILTRLWSLKDKTSFPFAIFLFTSSFYFLTLSGIRQWIAVSLVFYGSIFLKNHRYGVFSLFVMLATSFHFTALIAFLYLPLDAFFWQDLPPRLKNLIRVSIIFSPLIVFALFELVNRSGLVLRYSPLLGEEFFRVQIGRFLFIKISIVLLFLLEIVFSNREAGLFQKKNTLFYMWGLLLTFLAYFYRNISRIGWYFMVFEIVFFSSLARRKGMYQYLLNIFIVLITLYVFYQNLRGSSESHMPYIPFWLTR